MTEWHLIETAPRDGQVILTYWGKLLVFVAWVEQDPTLRKAYTGRWPFRKSHIIEQDENGWRVLMQTRDRGFGVHGNYAPFKPTHWMPLPEPPTEVP